MSQFTDQQYLKNDQYRDSKNLDARIELHRRFSTNSYGWFKWVFDTLVKLSADAKILELACGHGLLWKENADRIPSGWDITLSDLSAGMLDSAWRNLVVTGRNYKFKEIDAQQIPFADETFDVVIANHMLYHVPDRAKSVSEIKRVLKPRGRLIATTVGESHMNETHTWEKRVSRENLYGPFTSSFTLENGLEQLKAFFSQITIIRYPDNLRVTEVEPIIAYIRSMIRATDLSEDEITKIKLDLEAELKEKGEIFITKSSGLFEAVK